MLARKFRPPRARAQVRRSRLIDVLRTRWPRRLTVVHGPSGYGKTTLVAQWAAELADGGATVAWLAVDDNDNNPTWFMANLLEALRRVDPSMVGDLGVILEESGENVEKYVLTSLVNQIAECAESVIIVIDDWQRITSATVIDAMGFLLEQGSDNLQIVIASRSRSGLPLSRVRVRDELIEIDSDALCFDLAETQSFLIDVSGLDLQTENVIDIRSSTHGWAAGLQLASLSIRSAERPGEMIGQISGRHHAIAEYLAENVIAALKPELLDFLLTTSIIERICGSLASALTGKRHGQAMLEEVEARGLFLHRCDDNSDWYRYHHLFAGFLQRRLERDRPELVPALHRTASAWFADQHILVEAVDHALAAGDTRQALHLVEADGRRLLEHSQIATLFGLVDKLPGAAVWSSPKLLLSMAWADTFLHRTSAAREALNAADTALTAMHSGGMDVADLRAEVRVVEAALRAYTDDIDGVDELLSECLARPSAFSPFVVGAVANLKTHTAIYRADFDAAHRWQEWARPYHAQNSGPYVPTLGCARDGFAAFEQLDIDRAEQCFRTAWQLARKTGSVHSQVARLASAPLAELLYARGEIDEAERLLNESFKLGAEEGMVEWIRCRFVAGARLAVLRGDRAAAVDLLDEGADTAQRFAIPRLAATVENERALMGLRSRRAARVPVEFAQRRRPVDGIGEIVAQLEEDTAIHLLIAGSPTDEQADLACRWAREWVDRLQGRGRDRALLAAQRTLVECLAAGGRAADAKRLLSTILVRCADVGLVRFPLDGGPRVLPVIEELRNDLHRGTADATVPQPPTAFLDRLSRTAAHDATDATDAEAGAGAEALPGANAIGEPIDGRRLSVLGSDRPRWSTTDRFGHPKRKYLTGRHAEILVLLSQYPEGLTADHLAMLLDEGDLDTITVRAEVSRLRKNIGAEFIGSRPYRLLLPVPSDLDETLAALGSGDAETALSHYRGPLLPRSVSPAIGRLRTRLSTSIRSAAISSGDVTALRRWLSTPEGRDDREAWHILHQSSTDPMTRADAAGSLAGIDSELG